MWWPRACLCGCCVRAGTTRSLHKNSTTYTTFILFRSFLEGATNSVSSRLRCVRSSISDRRSCAQNEHPVLKKRSKHAPFACMTPVWPPIIISSSPRSSTRCGGCTFQSIKRTSSLVKAQVFHGGRTRWHTVGNRYRSVFSGCFWNADPREPPATL